MLLRLTIGLVAVLYVGMRFAPSPEENVYAEGPAQSGSAIVARASASAASDSPSVTAPEKRPARMTTRSGDMTLATAGVSGDAFGSQSGQDGQSLSLSSDASGPDAQVTRAAGSSQLAASTTQANDATGGSSSATGQAQAEIVATNVNVRAGPSTSRAVVTQVTEGDIVDYYGETENGWAEIGNPNTGGRVYMAHRFLQPTDQ